VQCFEKESELRVKILIGKPYSDLIEGNGHIALPVNKVTKKSAKSMVKVDNLNDTERLQGKICLVQFRSFMYNEHNTDPVLLAVIMRPIFMIDFGNTFKRSRCGGSFLTH
jgi:hypothetical protein